MRGAEGWAALGRWSQGGKGGLMKGPMDVSGVL